MGLAELKADLKHAYENLQKSDSVDIKTELAENLYPLLEGIVDAIREDMTEVRAEVDELGEMVDDIAEGSSEVLFPETSGKIMGLLQVGAMLAAELDKALPKLDEVSKKRVRGLTKSYRHGVQIVGELIAEITMPIEEPPAQTEGPDAAPGADDGEGEEHHDDDLDGDLEDLAADGGEG